MRLAASGLGLILLLSGCLLGGSTSSSGLAHPVGPTLARYGLRERCADEATCIDRAFEVARTIFHSLGERYDGPGDPAQPGVVPFTIDFDHDPPFDWRATDDVGPGGSGGTSGRISVDVTAILAGDGQAFAVIGGTGEGHAYVIPDDLARQLLDALFVPAD